MMVQRVLAAREEFEPGTLCEWTGSFFHRYRDKLRLPVRVANSAGESLVSLVSRETQGVINTP